jgi:transcriptional regulator with XRE-family HTH domain
MKVEVRAVGLKAMQEKRGLTQRKLAHDLGISQNYIPAIEANSRPGWSKPSALAGALLQMHLRGSVRGGVDRL